MSAPKIPYPPSPTDVPEGLTDFPESYLKQQNLLLAGLFVFLIFYISLVILFAMVGVWCVLTWKSLTVVKIIGAVLSGTFFLYLVKGFFKRHPMNKEMHIEITEDEHPVLFGFIYRVCDELGAPEPNKVYVSPDVNAAVMPRATLVNLFVQPKKDLLIGLGLVNCMNLTEFKSVLAHEFGHFSQSAMAGSYTYVAHRIIADLVDGEDWFDRLITWCKNQENVLKVFGYGVGGCLWVGRKILWWMYKTITLQRMAVMRESEFHADLLAVKAAGSDAVGLSLFRLRFGNLCLGQAVEDLATALDHKLYSKDIFLHQDRAAEVVRRKRKDARLGIPPVHNGPLAGQKIRVFDPEDEELADDVPEMRRTHPPAHELEENAKATFIPAVVDHRSPWVLFTDPADLRERMSYKFYRMVFRVPKNADLTDAQKVQEYIDNEHAETTYDPKYHGAYDDRPIEPGDLTDLNGLVRSSPWTDDRMEKVYDKLFDGCKEHAEAHADLHKELNSLKSNVVGKPSPKIKRMIEDIEKKMDENWEWFKSFDRRVYLLHVQMAAQVDPAMRDELVERYRFQMEVQRFYQEARSNFNKADWYIGAYHAAARGEIQVSNDFGAEVIAVLRAAWKALKTIVQDAREVNMPAMKNFAEGDRLADFILEGKLVPEPPLSELKGAWVHKLMTQLQGVKNRCFRLHFKSVGGILAIQEKAAAAWAAARAPVPAEVIEAEPLPVEYVGEALVGEPLPGDEVVAAEVLPADVVVTADVIAAEVVEVVEPLPIDAIPVEVVDEVPAVVVPPEPPTAGAVAATGDVPDVAVVAEPGPEPVFSFDPPAGVGSGHEGTAPQEPEAAKGGEPGPVFSFDPEPATTPEPPPRVESAAAEPEPVFSFDPSPEAANPVAEELPANPVAQTLALGAVEPEAAEIFSLDPDEQPPEPKPAPKSAAASPPAPAVEPEDIFSLDGDEEPVAAEVLDLDEPAPAKPEPVVLPHLAGKAPMGAQSGATAAPHRVPEPALTEPASGTLLPASGKRPAVRITFVKPGEKSPFAT